MDESECKRGSMIFGNDVSDYVNAQGKRLVACVNWLSEMEVDNHNAQQRLLQMLDRRITYLESRLLELESR